MCDAGCGTGSLSMAAEGADVLASDISAAMVSEAQRQAQAALAARPAGSPFRMPRFEVRDLESLEGRYDVVVCLDVLIHYPHEEARAMIRHLASLTGERLLISFAPRRSTSTCSSASASCSRARPRPRAPTCTPSATSRTRSATPAGASPTAASSPRSSTSPSSSTPCPPASTRSRRRA